MNSANVFALRDSMVDRLVEARWITSDPVDRAFRAVSRHVFLPGLDPTTAYADEAVVTDRDSAGRPISSSSQPSVMAIMLEQLDLRPGHRVLEIGTGTGYNAALLAGLVGSNGSVVTIDIDADVLRRARLNLDQAGRGRVRVVHADGAAGWASEAPYDRIIVTVGAWDIAPQWPRQLAAGGRLVLPLSVRGAQRSVAFEQTSDALVSVSIADCGFMPMRGELAGPGSARPLNWPGVFLYVDDERDLDSSAISVVLQTPGQPASTGIRGTAAEMGGLDLWLSLHEPDVVRLAALGAAVDLGIVPALASYPGMTSSIAVTDGRSLAALSRGRDETKQPDEPVELHVRGYGPGSDALAGRLTDHVRTWAQRGRPSTASLSIRAYPPAAMLDEPTGSIVVDKPHSRLVLDLN